jgi:hypothetical protein
MMGWMDGWMDGWMVVFVMVDGRKSHYSTKKEQAARGKES